MGWRRAKHGMAEGKAWAIGASIFAATLLLVIGVFQFFQGLAAVLRGGFFFVTPNYVYAVSLAAWGWIHLVLGVVLVVTACFLFTGATWARITGIALVAFSAIANFFFLPYFPLWSLVIIGIDVVIIWALATASLAPVAQAGPLSDSEPGYAPQQAEMQTRDVQRRWPGNPPFTGGAGQSPEVSSDRRPSAERPRVERSSPGRRDQRVARERTPDQP